MRLVLETCLLGQSFESKKVGLDVNAEKIKNKFIFRFQNAEQMKVQRWTISSSKMLQTSSILKRPKQIKSTFTKEL
jgi:hypothetical protein